MDDKMTNVYQFPSGNSSVVQPLHPGKVKTRTSGAFFWIRLAIASVLHVLFLTPLLVILKFRMPVFVLAAAYSLNFFFSHDHNLWTATDHTAIYTVAAVCAVLIVGPVIGVIERKKPFHRLFSVVKN